MTWAQSESPVHRLPHYKNFTVILTN